jgi:hypothetical protein
MEEVQQGDLVADRGRRNYERYGWVILMVSATLGIFAAVVTAIPPAYVELTSPFFEGTYAVMAALGIISVGFNIFALVMIVVPYRREERWAWYTLWLLPLMWLSQFALAPDLPFYLVLAIMTTVGLILPYRGFFSGPEDEGLV